MPTTRPPRIVIEELSPKVSGGDFSLKRVIGEPLRVQAVIYADGHQEISADLLVRKQGSSKWDSFPMKPIGNDIWEANFCGGEIGLYEIQVEGWINRYKTYTHDLAKKKEAGCELAIEYQIGIKLIAERSKAAPAVRKKALQGILETLKNAEDPYPLFFDPQLLELMRADHQNRASSEIITCRYQRKRALFSSWYELFPRSFGGFSGVTAELPHIAKMGFNVLYLPPIHPIGVSKRKGKNNAKQAAPGDPGSPWAIGSREGGHDALNSELGTSREFSAMVKRAKELGIEIALDLALQCSPDHPYVKEHPEWFLFRPDGSVQYAENPPKKYEDIIPIHFDTDRWQELWNELLRVVLLWVEKGITIFRVDNPHTKPFAFWQWLIGRVREKHQEVLFLAEAFTRPHVMQQLAKIGFDQSYTYFSWRNHKWEITDYLQELVHSNTREYFRPNFWPNTPDILPEYLQQGGKAAFLIRFILAATLSSNYGIYGPAFELCQNRAVEGKEEYADSEKYECKEWKREQAGAFVDLISVVNHLRNSHEAFQTTWNLHFCPLNNDMLIAYLKLENFLIVVNLDPFNTQIGSIEVPLELIGIDNETPYLVHDHLSNRKFTWRGRWQYIELNPHQMPAHIFEIYSKPKKEEDFDYFM